MTQTQLPTIRIGEAARRCGATVGTVRRWMKSGKLRAVIVGGRFRTTDEWIAEFVKPADGSPAANESLEEAHLEKAAYEESVKNLWLKFGIGPAAPGKVSRPACPNESEFRGVCIACLATFRRAVNSGKTTWEKLEAKGLVRPSRPGRRSAASEAIDQLN